MSADDLRPRERLSWTGLKIWPQSHLADEGTHTVAQTGHSRGIAYFIACSMAALATGAISA